MADYISVTDTAKLTTVYHRLNLEKNVGSSYRQPS